MLNKSVLLEKKHFTMLNGHVCNYCLQDRLMGIEYQSESPSLDFTSRAAIPFTLFLLLIAIVLLFLIMNQKLATTSSERSTFVGNVPGGQKYETSSLRSVYSTTHLPCDDGQLSRM